MENKKHTLSREAWQDYRGAARMMMKGPLEALGAVYEAVFDRMGNKEVREMLPPEEWRRMVECIVLDYRRGFEAVDEMLNAMKEEGLFTVSADGTDGNGAPENTGGTEANHSHDRRSCSRRKTFLSRLLQKM